MSLTARIVSALLAAFVVAIILKLQRRGGMVSKYGLLWMATSAILLVMAAAPDVVDTIGGWLGVEYRVQVLMEEVALLRRELEDRREDEDLADGGGGAEAV